jgi:ribosomal protein S18 acetylase RimI-like enzyme
MSIKLATNNDFESICILRDQIHNRHVSIEPNHFKVNTKTLTEEMYDDLLNKNAVYVITDNINDVLCGYFIIDISDLLNHPLFIDQKILFIFDICIDKKYRRMGYGTQIMNEIEKIAKEKKCTKIELNVWHKNIEAKEFYKKWGMREKSSILLKEINY